MAKAIDSMTRALDEARSLACCEQAFGLTFAERSDVPSVTRIYLGNGEAEFEIETKNKKGRFAPCELGSAYSRIAFAVEELAAERARFRELGCGPRDIAELEPGGALPACFFRLENPDGDTFEAPRRHGRNR